MDEERASYRQILRSTSIVGGATAGSIVIALVRTKIITLFVGVAGIGLLGVFNAILMAGSLIAGLGIATSGVRELAATGENAEAAGRVGGALWALTWLLALAGSLGLWLLREPIARLAMGGVEHAAAVGWLALGVGLSVIAATQSAVLQGFRRVGNVARVKLYGAGLAAVVGVIAVAADPYRGLVAALLAIPLASILIASLYRRSVPRARLRTLSPWQAWSEWQLLVGLGFSVMLWYAIGSVTQIVVRAIIVRESGLGAAGLFQASWMISATYLNLILAAMSVDYLPRLSAVSKDAEATNRLVNQQLHVALLLGLPMIAAMVAAAPLVLTILYSADFVAAARMLQWQLAGDVLKLVGWAVGFVLLARRDMVPFLLAELALSLLYAALLYALLPVIGIDAAGLGYFVGYLLYALIVAATCWRKHGIGMSRSNFRLTALSVAVLVALVLVATRSQAAAFVAGIAVCAVFTVYALRQLEGAAGALPNGARAFLTRLRIL